MINPIKKLTKLFKTDKIINNSQDEFVIARKNNSDRFLLALGEALSKKKTSSSTKIFKRIPFDKLELCYLMDEVIFRCVNFYALQVGGVKFEIISKNKNAKNIIENFCRTINLSNKAVEITRDLCITGNSFYEKVYSMTGKLIDIQRIDYKTIDYERDSRELVIEDESGKPKGYIYKGYTGNEISKLDSSSILHFKLFSLGNELAIGFIEPVYRLVYLKANIRHGFAQAGYRMGHPMNIIYIGDPENPKTGYTGHRPTKELVDKIESEWADIETKNVFIMPYYSKVEQLKPITVETQHELLKYCDSRIAASFGIPPEVAFGENASNKATLEILITRDLDRRIKAIQNIIANVLENELFPEILSQYNIEDNVKIRWHEITPADLNRKAKRIIEYIQAGVLNPEDVRNMILDEEGLKSPLSEREVFSGIENLQQEITLIEAVRLLKDIQVSFPQESIIEYSNQLISILMREFKPTQFPRIKEGILMIPRKHILTEEAILGIKMIKNTFKNKLVKELCDKLIELLEMKL
ncbi:MAG: phage portal protein [Promethearchaeota archaeon]